MKRTWSATDCWLAVGVACAAVCVVVGTGGAAVGQPKDNDSTLPVEGGTVDTGRPAIYRLPPVLPLEADLSLPDDADETLSEPLPPNAPSARENPQSAIRNPQLSLPAAPPTDVAPAPYSPRDATVALYSPTAAELTAQLLPAVQHGCALAQRGALYAARAEFIQVLRRIAQANDAERGTDAHSRALAEGLRALDEAGDFVPAGVGLEGDLDLQILASSHRTPVLRDAAAIAGRTDPVLPHEAVAMYLGFAQERLAAAVAGQQTGSMVLYGLGKIHARLAEGNGGDATTARSAMTMYLAALAACPANHLAANELGVLLCRNGHAAEAAPLFEQSIDFAPSATAYHNLAVAQQKLGLPGPAAANQRESERLAAWERATGAVSRRAGVRWISPDAMAQVASPAMPVMPMAGGAAPPAAQPPATVGGAPAKSPWHKVLDLAKSVTGAGDDTIQR